jgi:TolB-like protein
VALTSGTRLAHRIVSAIGAGGMGEVYKTRDTRLQRDVAIKVLPRDFASDPERIQRFEQEARSASALNHPNILTIHDVGREGEIVYFVMEWVDGQTLRELLAGGRLPLRRALDLCHQIAEGLAKAHAAGVVHRDLKPENVMVSADGFAKIVDFGLAKLTEVRAPATDALTRTVGTTPGVVMGTFAYMSPEQASGRPVDYRSDQFALGVLTYELTTGTRPFARPTAVQSMAATIEDEPEPIDRLNPHVPARLAAVVARCLAKDPVERYESTRDLARDLKELREMRSHTAAGGAPAARRASPLVIVAAVALVIAGVVAAWSWRRLPGVAPEPQRPLVAVRVLRNLSPDPAQGYFAAGMTEEIRGQLSQVSGLRILSENALTGSTGDVFPRARELRVGSLVEGSVRVDGDRVRIAAALIDVTTQQTLWSEQYDRDLADVFAVQSDVALRIVEALRAKLSPGERKRVERRSTENLEAYRLYLQSQSLSISERATNLAAIEQLRQALALDPTFAAARARLAYRLVFMGYYDEASWIDKGVAEAQAAVRLDPSLDTAHSALAIGYARKGLATQARLSFLRALELNPSATSSIGNLSIHEGTYGRFEESLYWARRAFALSGKRDGNYYTVAQPLLGLRDDELTRWWLAEGERRFADSPSLQVVHALAELLEGRPADADTRLSRALARSPDNEELKMTRADVAFVAASDDLQTILDPLMKASAASASQWVPETVRVRYAYALGKRGETARAAVLVADAERVALDRIAHGDETPDLRVELAAISALRREHDAALQWLSRAYDSGYRYFGLLERDPIMVALRADQRFREILERMRHDVDAQRQRARERGLLDLQALLAPQNERTSWMNHAFPRQIADVGNERDDRSRWWQAGGTLSNVDLQIRRVGIRGTQSETAFCSGFLRVCNSERFDLRLPAGGRNHHLSKLSC